MAVIDRTRAEQVPLGMILLGLVSSSMCYGLTVMQTYRYFKRFHGDHGFIKALVIIVFGLDTVSAFFITHASWFYLVTNGSPGIMVWSLPLELITATMLSGIAKLFFAYRVWKISGRHVILTGVIVFFAVIHFVSSQVSAIQFYVLKEFARFGTVEPATIVRLASACICDIGTATSLCYFLHKKRTGYARTDQIIDKLIEFSINTGIFTSVLALAVMISYIVMPYTWAFIGLCFLISRFYSNAILCALNSREAVLSNPLSTPDSAPRYPSNHRRGNSFLTTCNLEKRQSTNNTQTDVFIVVETSTSSGAMDVERDEDSRPSVKRASL